MKRYGGMIATHTALALWIMVGIAPILMLLAASLNRSSVARYPRDILLMRSFTLDNFASILRTGDIFPLFFNSLFYAFGVLLVGLSISTTIAFGINKIPGDTGKRMSILLLIMRYIPYIVIAIPLFVIFTTLGMSGSRTGVLIAHLSLVIPLTSWLVIGFFNELPMEIEEAALIDGCSSFGVFWRVSLPMARPGVISAGILAFIASWNDYLYGLFLGGRNARTIATGIFRWVGTEGQRPDYGIIAAYSILIILPVLVFTALTSKYIVSGLTDGAVKS